MPRKVSGRLIFLEENKSNAVFPGMISYIMMDANNLKKINDSLGHNKGDEFIITIAKCMRAAVGQNGQCYRIGGDEFVIILRQPKLIHCADEKMYKDKKRIKENTPSA